MTVGSAREAALLALTACETQGAWSDGYLKRIGRESALDSRDMALATRLCFGVLQNKLLLDFYLAYLCSCKLEQLEIKVLNSLRLGAYQILMLDRIPDSAAVNESVKLARCYAKNPKAAGMVNGILRNLIRRREELPEPPDLATRYSHPSWLVDAFSERLGIEETEQLLIEDNGLPPTYAQVNTCLATAEEVASQLRAEGVQVDLHPWLPGCLLLSDTGNIEKLKAFRDGLFYIQDAAARLSVLAADPKPGMDVLDACAAPGGKSFAAAIQMGDCGTVVSCDIHPHKERLIRSGAERLRLKSIQTQTLNNKVCKPEFLHRFDLVIADVPCSGLGIIRKKPDIRYKEPGPLKQLPRIQEEILYNVADYVRPGGTLLYSTCTLLKRENELVVSAFLERRKDFTAVKAELPAGFSDCELVTCWPHRNHTDGFFFAKLKREP